MIGQCKRAVAGQRSVCRDDTDDDRDGMDGRGRGPGEPTPDADGRAVPAGGPEKIRGES